MSKAVSAARRHFPKAKQVEQAEAVVIDGKLYGTTELVMQMFSVTNRTVRNWQKEGLEYAAGGVPRFQNLFELADVVRWVGAHQPQAKSSKVGRLKGASASNLDDLDLATATKEDLDRLKVMEEVKKKRLENAEARGQLIPAEDQDRAMAEQAVLHRGQYLDDFEVLPGALEGQTKNQIKAFLRGHYERRMKNLHDFITKEFDMPDWLNHKIHELIEREVEVE
jgi:hypothetical protein